MTPYVVPILFPQYLEVTEMIQILSISVIPSTLNLNYASKFLGQEKNKIVFGGSLVYLPIQIITIIILLVMMAVRYGWDTDQELMR